jgi:peroxiredoxin/DNA-binding transcriptional MerR regulator
MRIGEVALKAGVSTKAVRYYESLGLLAPARSSNGYRDYREQHVRAVREIAAVSRLGLPVQRARVFLDCLDAGHDHADDCPSSLAAYRDAIDDLTDRIEVLQARRAALQRRLHDAACRPTADPATAGELLPTASRRHPDDEHPEAAMTDHERLPAGLPVPVDDGAAAHLPGTSVPRWSLPSTDGQQVDLARLPHRTVLYIYPLSGRPDVDLPHGWDTIPGARGCTTEACDFRDHHQQLLAAGAGAVFGLSSQDSDYQRELVHRLRLPFAMLSDTRLRLADMMRLPTFVAGGMPLYKRVTLVVSDGAVEHAFYPIFPPNEHAQQVLRWLEEHPVPSI